MNSNDPRRKVARKTQIESLEDRLAMSADTLGGLLGGLVEHHAIVEKHGGSIEHHVQQSPDFWIDPADTYNLEQHLFEIEKALASAHGQTGLTQVRNNYGFMGGGQTVAVIDSGVAYTHYALGGGFGANYRVVGGYDFTEIGAGALDPYDDGPHGGHGTHVSGIVGGNAGSNSGVAPEVDLVGLRVFDDTGAGYFSWVEQALDWVHANRNAFENPITAVNLSLGAAWNSNTVPNWAMLEDEFAQLKADGIFIAVSAGNSFQDYNAPGLGYPAASPHVVPVMSTDDDGNLSYFSQRHSRAIAAPGRTITSTVPDYAAGDADTVDDDFASWSGTSMAAPYVAGASVIIRQAMEFVGYTNITQDTIYNHIIATADQFFDSATSAWYNRLDLGAAIAALMPADDYGSTAGTAFGLGNLSSFSTVSGLIGTLSDADFFTFTADITGTVTFTADTTHDLDVTWAGAGASSGSQGEVFTMDVIAGQTYTVGISTSDGIGYYDIAVDAQSSFNFTDWGAIASATMTGTSVSNDSWYRVVAANAGYLTVEATYNTAGGPVSLELYNANQQLIGVGAASGGAARVDVYASSGQEFFIRAVGANSDVDFQVTNLVSLVGSTVHVTGTSGNDAFAVRGGASHILSVNGVGYQFSSSAVASINVAGNAGADVLRLSNADSFTFSINSVETCVDLDAVANALNADLGLYTTSNQYLNWGGWGERWVMSTNGSWHFITPSGEFYRYTSGNNLATSTWIATLDASFFNDIAKLTGATATSFMNGTYAASLDTTHMLYFSQSYFENWGGMGEKWIKTGEGGWYFITPDGNFYRWNGANDLSQSQMVASLDSSYHADPTRLHDAGTGSMHHDLAMKLDQELGLSLSGSYCVNWGGLNEKWVRAADNQWYYITPSGGFYRWSGSSKLIGSQLVAVLDASFHHMPNRLHEMATGPAGQGGVAGQATGDAPSLNFHFNQGGRSSVADATVLKEVPGQVATAGLLDYALALLQQGSFGDTEERVAADLVDNYRSDQRWEDVQDVDEAFATDLLLVPIGNTALDHV